MTSLVVADVQQGSLAESTRRSVTAAVILREPVDVLLAGLGLSEAARSASQLDGVRKVILADADVFKHSFAEPLAELIQSLASGYSAIVAAATSTGKNVMPRVAALLDVMQVSEVTKILSPDTFERPIYAGNAIQTVTAGDPIRVITIRPSAFEPAKEGTASAPIESIDPSISARPAKFENAAASQSARPELTSAKIVISGGRALQSADNFQRLIGPIADRLGAAIGASRAAVDAGFASNDLQVGQTGKVVAPDLYIAVGISGAIQHLAGMKDFKVIVAINKDPEAPIFQVADYGLVEDLFSALPELAEELAKLKG